MNKQLKTRSSEVRQPAFGRKTISTLTFAQLEEVVGGDDAPPGDSIKKFEGPSMEAD